MIRQCVQRSLLRSRRRRLSPPLLVHGPIVVVAPLSSLPRPPLDHDRDHHRDQNVESPHRPHDILPSSRSFSTVVSSSNRFQTRRRPDPLPGTPTLRRSLGISRHPDPLVPDEDRSLNSRVDDEDDVDEDVDDGEGKLTSLGGGTRKKMLVTADDLELADVWDGSKEKENDDDDGEEEDYYGHDDDDDDDDDDGEYRDIFGDIFASSSKSSLSKHSLVKDEVELSPLARQNLKFEEIHRELDNRKGRLWEDSWVITDDEWTSTETMDDMEDWNPNLATRKSLESVKVFDGGVPTLHQLSTLPLPPQPPPHPGHGTPAIHAKHRKLHIQTRLRTAIQLAIHDDLRQLLEMTEWRQKQEKVDELFEGIEEKVRQREPILGKLPDFGELVEKGLEDVLEMVQSRMRGVEKETKTKGRETTESEVESNDQPTDMEQLVDVMNVRGEPIVPIFMDLAAAAKQRPDTLSEFFSRSNEAGVPNLVYPLNVHHNDGVGRMVEEWELAANKETKRIMMREAMKDVAGKIVEATEGSDKGAARVMVVGKRGVGKTATLAGIVASARVSGHIVAYFPDGDRLRRYGHYVEPSSHRHGLFDLPEIAKEFCTELSSAHGSDVASMTASKERMKKFLTDGQIDRVFRRKDDASDGDASEAPTEISLDQLLEIGSGSTSLSSGCYCTVIDVLMNQTEKPFTVAMDEFNCYYDHGHYTHMDFDPTAFTYMPLNKITIFKPFLEAMGLYPSVAGTNIVDESEGDTLMKWGSVVVAVSDSKAVKTEFDNALVASARALATAEKSPVHIVDVRRFNPLEVQHVLYNYEVTGVGRLRFDRGDTALNPEEVAYLRMVSGGLGQPLLNACMLP